MKNNLNIISYVFAVVMMAACQSMSLYLTQTPEPTTTPIFPKPSSTPLPSATPGVMATAGRTGEVLTVVYQDGRTLDVYDWTFLYHYGESDQKVSFGELYFIKSKVSQDLYLQVDDPRPGSGVDIWEMDFKSRDLRRIIYEYDPEQKDALTGIVFLTKVEPVYIGFWDMEISDTFLSSKPYVFEKHVYLKGKTLLEDEPQDIQIEVLGWMQKSDADALVRIVFQD